MRIRTLALTATAGVALLAATMFQASALWRTAAVPVATVSAAAPATRVAAEGRVVAYPGSEIHVAAERGGRLVRVLVEEGRTVRQGELMAEIEADELRASLDQVRARVAEADAEIRLAEINQRRRQELVAQKVVAAHDLDQATRDLDIARARRDTARAETTRLEAQLRKTRIVAPISGTVVARVIDPGETVEAGDHLLTVADLSRLRIEGEADEADAASLVHGAPVEITAAGYPGRRWQGAIEDVAEAVSVRRVKPQDPGRPTDTRVLMVKVAFGEPSPLKLGTTVELAITGPSSR